MAFTQRVINDGGSIHREYALDRKRADLLIYWQGTKIVLEIKGRRGEESLSKGLEQITDYIDISGAKEGHLIIFIRDATNSWEEKISHERIVFKNKEIYA